ncbi:MAG TPA: outer membrane beta-barrel protein [Acidobacteriaceae bacterium]|nr:outer membrane beta-barrel protein [Acidobacteriaceae bacterium]
MLHCPRHRQAAAPVDGREARLPARRIAAAQSSYTEEDGCCRQSSNGILTGGPMQPSRISSVFLVLAVVFGATAASAQTDVALSVYGAFNSSTNGNGIAQSPSNAAGGLLEFRHISNPVLGFEATYSFNRANQTYQPTRYACPAGLLPCTAPAPTSVSADAHAVTLDWVPSVKIANLRPFGVAGIGMLVNDPTSGTDTSSNTTLVYVYGAGLDWGLLPHLGLRGQFREMTYKAPDLTTLYTSTGSFLHTAEPMLGIYLSF